MHTFNSTLLRVHFGKTMLHLLFFFSRRKLHSIDTRTNERRTSERTNDVYEDHHPCQKGVILK